MSGVDETGPEDFGPDDRDQLEAAEYVLGVTDAGARAASAARLERDSDFAAKVSWWEARFAPLLAAYKDVEPAADLWLRIERRLSGQEEQSGRDEGGAAPLPPIAANDAEGVAPWWRPFGLGMTAVAAGLTAMLLTQTPETVRVRVPVPSEEPAPALVPLQLLSARVAPEAGIPVAVITYDPGSERLIVSPVDLDNAAGRTPELWFIPQDGTPRSLGIIPANEGVSVRLPAEFSPDSTLAISIEPDGGSPTGLPTGPIVGTGTLDEI